MPEPSRHLIKPRRRGFTGASGVQRTWRAPIIGVAVVALAIGVLADGGGVRHAGALPVGPPSGAAPAGALSSSWFCAGGTAGAKSAAPGSLVLVNVGARAVGGQAHLVDAGGHARTVDLSVAPRSQQQLTEDAGSGWEAATVTFDGGEAAVEQQVSTPEGRVAVPCASTGSASWYFADGTTIRDARDELSLYNPYSGASVVDLSFTTEQGQEDPSDFQGLVVQSGQVLTVDLGSHLRLRRNIAITLQAREGKVVAFRTELVSPPAAGVAVLGTPGAVDPAAPIGGTTLELGTPVPAATWWWPAGETEPGLDERYAVYNPGSTPAQVRVSFLLGQGSASPYPLTVAPHGVGRLNVADQPGVPTGVVHEVELQSINGVPVVAERSISGSSPSTVIGLGALPGLDSPARHWLLAGAGAGASGETISVVNVGTAPTHLDVESLVGGTPTPLAGTGTLVVEAGHRTTISVPADGATAPLTVSGDQPLEVEQDAYATPPQPGISLAPGIPLAS
jgi:hypothetical protein